jgi:Ca2+-binding EF-hand superfamily protein
MNFNMKNALLTLALLSATSDAFMLATPPSRTLTSSRAFVQSSNLKSNLKSVRLHVKEDNDNEIDRLETIAATLRAEAAALEAGRAQELADAAERAFRKFDTDQDGEISLTELKAGLEQIFKIKLSEKRVQDLLADFDKNGDGKLQLDEFGGVEKFRTSMAFSLPDSS